MLERTSLEDIWFKYDPFDLALTCADGTDGTTLRGLLATRPAPLERLIQGRRDVIAAALSCISELDEWALKHSLYRLDAETCYLTDLLAWRDEKNGSCSPRFAGAD